MKKSIRTGLAGLLLVLTAAPAASAANVTVRVEGAGAPLVRQTTVQTGPSVSVDKTGEGGRTCAGTTAGGALELATGGDWGGRGDSQGQRVERIKGETHLLGTEYSGIFWSFYINNAPSYLGVCSFTPQDGDELLFEPACSPQLAGCFEGDPLDVRAPAVVAPGASFKVGVDEYTSQFGASSATATKAPSQGATVKGDGVDALTGADGTAMVSLATPGPHELIATKGSRVRDEVTVCVTTGADGSCGSAAPGAPSAPARGGGGPTADTKGPVSQIGGIREGQRFKRGRGPRTLGGTVSDPGGLASVELALTRGHRGRCTAFNGQQARFRKIECGRHPLFAIGDRGAFSFLLPARLKTGRYVLDVVSTDKAGNREGLYRGRNRVVFKVR